MDMVASVPSRTAGSAGIELLGGFRFVQDGHQETSVSEGSQRLLAVLALSLAPLTRLGVAGALWPESSEDRAYSSLRSALARMHPEHREAMSIGQRNLGIAEGVAVDVREKQDLAAQLLAPDVPSSDCDLSASTAAAFSLELLPGWYDDWVLVAGEKWRQLRLHALEAMAERLSEQRRFGEALVCILAAITAEPLRESAYALLIRLHLAEGNQSEALKAFERYRLVLHHELALPPTRRLIDLVADLQPSGSPFAESFS
jgi:DNA-binding SARP family transcriptional activator